MNCPNCGGTHLVKRGYRAGKQRYRCNTCKASFTEGVPYKAQVRLEPLTGIVCPRCGETCITRDGKSELGEPRYRCKACNLRFQDSTVYDPNKEVKWECPYCGGKLIRAGHGKKGQIQYTCKSCGKTCSGDLTTGEPQKRFLFKQVNWKISCPDCDSYDIKKAGFYKNGQQRYHCNYCGRSFHEGARKSPREIIKEVVKEVTSGKSTGPIAERYGYTPRHFRRLLKPLYDIEAKYITENQKDLIYKVGVCLGVPVEFIAPYIGCSEYYCRKFIKEHKRHIKI